MRKVLLLAFIALLTSSPAWATWSTSSGWSAAGTTTASLTCSPACPAQTIPSTTAGDVLYAEFYNFAGTSKTLLSGTGVGGTWVFDANCNKTQSGAGDISCGYVIIGTGGATTVTLTINASVSGIFLHFRSYHSSVGGVAAETVPAATGSAGCSNNCTTPTVTLAGTADLVIATIAAGNTGCSVASPFGNFAAPSGNGIADRLNTSAGTGATFTQGSSCPTAASGASAMSTVAFSESAGGVIAGFNKRKKLEKIGP